MLVTCGVLQGSVLRPLLWNVVYDTMFHLPLPRGIIIIGYANDILIIAEEFTKEAMQNRANAAIGTVSGHIRDQGLRFVVMFRNQYGQGETQLWIQDQAAVLEATLKYLDFENK